MFTEHDIQAYEIELTSNCNAECPLCHRTKAKMPLRGNDVITLSDITRLFSTREQIEGKEFNMCGVLGDPIVNPECLEICEYLVRNGGNVSLSTNGGYNSAEWWERMAQTGAHVSFAIDGMEQTNHLYRVNVNWTTLERNIRAFSNAGGDGSWVYITFDHNDSEFEKAKEFAKELKFTFKSRTGGRNVLNSGKKHQPRKGSSVVLMPSTTKESAGDMNKIKTIRTAQMSGNADALKEAVGTISCKHLQRKEVFIAANLRLWPCCYVHSSNVDYNNSRFNLDKPDEWNSLRHHTISEILSTDNFNIHDRWNVDDPYYVRTCVITCADNGVYKEKSKIVRHRYDKS